MFLFFEFIFLIIISSLHIFSLILDMHSFIRFVVLLVVATLANTKVTTVCEENGHTATLKHFIQLLQQQPCVQIIEETIIKNRSIRKRNTDASGNIDVYALQTTINDHRTMINYLINNSINATYVNNAILDHYSKTGPIFSSWRDLIDIFTVMFLVSYLIYSCMCRAGGTTTSCDKMISFCCQPCMARMAQNQTATKDKESKPTMNNFTEAPRRKSTKRRPLESSVASIEGDMIRYYNGYTSE